MLLANSAIISEAAGPSAWKRTSEPNSWQFSDLWSAFPEFANSIRCYSDPKVVAARPYRKCRRLSIW
jgi:hypothetical protein